MTLHETLQDQFYNFVDKKDKTHLKMTQMENFIEVEEEDTLLQLFFRQDLYEFHYDRGGFTLVDILANLGGFFSVLFAVGNVVSYFIQLQFKMAKMLKQLYQVESKNEEFMAK